MNFHPVRPRRPLPNLPGRTFLLLISFAALVLPGFAAETARRERPNILFILTDDQSYKTLGCYGGGPDWVRTANIDRLAARGVGFERSYFGAWCMPARASLLTGRLQHAIMSMTMEGQYPGSSYDPQQCPFFPAQFRKQGYHTAQIGKWHTGTDTGFGRDWDHQIAWNRPGRPQNAAQYYTNQLLTIDGVDRMVEGYSTDNYTKWAVEYINGGNRDTNKPWFLWLCYGAPHGPTTPADRHRGTLAGKSAPVPADIFGPWPEKPAYLEKNKAWLLGPDGRPAMAVRRRAPGGGETIVVGQSFDAWVQQVNECMAAVDEGVGKIMVALETSGQMANTLVVYASDQGYGLGEHGFNNKFAPYDATISSPLIVAWPGRIPEGAVCRHPVNAPDLVDFLCRSAGVTVPWKMHGRDIRKLITTPGTTEWKSPMLMTHTYRYYGSETSEIPTGEKLTASLGIPWYALLRDGRYKYIRYLQAGESEELFDLDSDPDELENLAPRPEFTALLRSLRAKTVAELRRTDAVFVDRMPPTRAETHASIR
jgi:arylsulfatase A-like enzyme